MEDIVLVPKVYKDEDGYMQMLDDVMKYGIDTENRTGVGCRKMTDATLYFDLREGFPAPTVRSTPLRIAFEEFWAFLNGRVDIHTYLIEKNIRIWEGNTTREFLDNRGLTNIPAGHMGKAYSFQFRNFGGEYDEMFNPVGGIDQIKQVYEQLRDNPFSRRHLVTIWNPTQEKEMALPPCWWSHQFTCIKDKSGQIILNLKVLSRSADIVYGTPFNAQQYAIYLIAIAKSLGYVPGVLSCNMADIHIYHNQFEYVNETLGRDYSDQMAQIEITKDLNNLEDVLSLTIDDIVLKNHHLNTTKYKTTKPPMAV